MSGAILFQSPNDDPVVWERQMTAYLGAQDFRVWPEAGDVEEIEVALVWKPPKGMLERVPNLRLIASLGMGVDHIFLDPDVPEGVPVARIVDPDMVEQMNEYVLFAVLDHYRGFDRYERLRRAGEWKQMRPPAIERYRVGILGLGAIGAETARRLASLGFHVAGWSRTPKTLPDVECFDGPEGFTPFLARSEIVVCLLPLTPETEGILDDTAFAAMPAGGFVVNAARGGHVVEEDLLAALESGQLAGATLDVFQTEPLPAGHAFWDHPRVRMTPHIASLTRAETASRQIADNIRRLRAGEKLENLVDRSKGY